MTTTQISWWLQRGYDEATAKIKVSEEQSRRARVGGNRILATWQTKFPIGYKKGLWTTTSLPYRVVVARGSKNGKTCIVVDVTCNCGYHQTIAAHVLAHPNRHMGCINCRRRIVGQVNSRWSGHKELTGTLFQHIRHSAKNRNIPFSVTKEFLYGLFQTQKGTCALSGMPISWSEASLDRIDSNLGYVDTNVQWVHKKINIMKHTMPEPEFKMWCEKVHNHTISKLQ